MDRNYHIFSHGRLERAEDTLRLVTEEGDKNYIPIERVEAVFLHGQIDFNTRLMSFLDDHGVAIHVFGWNDRYAGSLMPKRGQTSGRTVVEQVRAYDDPKRRLPIAAAWVQGSIHNMRANVRYYGNRGYDFQTVVEELSELYRRVEDTSSVEELMGVEANARRAYYSTFDSILPDALGFEGRSYNPPPNEVNSMISYGNGLLYANGVSAIRATALDPAISYLHEPGERRYSLALDLAEPFKPILVDRIIFRLANRGQISEEDFRQEMGGCLLADEARKTFTKTFEKNLEETVKHPRLKRKVSYQYLLRIEVYKLKKHLLTGEDFEALHRWW